MTEYDSWYKSGEGRTVRRDADSGARDGVLPVHGVQRPGGMVGLRCGSTVLHRRRYREVRPPEQSISSARGRATRNSSRSKPAVCSTKPTSSFTIPSSVTRSLNRSRDRRRPSSTPASAPTASGRYRRKSTPEWYGRLAPVTTSSG